MYGEEGLGDGDTSFLCILLLVASPDFVSLIVMAPISELASVLVNEIPVLANRLRKYDEQNFQLQLRSRTWRRKSPIHLSDEPELRVSSSTRGPNEQNVDLGSSESALSAGTKRRGAPVGIMTVSDTRTH
ncbi:hypothetical protein B0H10DRAFT_1950522 [Mycena sp. CBHHK59/15]|nr:hypothetical protein B0H10DRAFT_1950522 [Mycena sp. CBHHK59/15]